MKLKKSILLLAAVSAISFCFNACGDDDKDKDKDKTPSEPATVSCTAADNHCDGSVLYICTSEGMSKQTCASNQICDVAHLRCKTNASKKCTEADNECRENVLWLCQNGRMIESENCGTSKYCNASKKTCESQCTEANNRCDGNAVYKCEGGTLVKKEDCGSDKVCNGDTLTCDTPCTAADNKCVNNVLYKCDLSGDKTVKLTPCNKRFCSESSWSCEKQGCSASDNACIENADGSWTLRKCTRDTATGKTALVDTKCSDKPFCSPFTWSCEATKPPECIKNECVDATHLQVCDAGGTWKKERTDCALQGKVCNYGQCVVPTICTKNEAKCVSNSEYVLCGDNAWNEADKKTCPSGTHCVVGGTCVADDPVVVKDSAIGSKCSCPDSERGCVVQIKGADITSFFNVDGLCPALSLADDSNECKGAKFLLNTVISSKEFQNATVTLPDLFLRKGENGNESVFQGCDDLKAYASADTGFAVTCWRDAKITFDENAAATLDMVGNIVNLIGPYLASSGFSFDGADIPGLIAYIKDKFKDGIPLTAGTSGNGGYCMLADLDIELSLKNETLNQMVNMQVLDVLLEQGINSPNHDHSKSKFAECPEGSTKLWFDVPSVSSTGAANIGFDVCMKTCKEDTDCRNGNTCQFLLYGNENTMLEDASLGAKVCFDQNNIKYFQDLSHDIDTYLPIGDED